MNHMKRAAVCLMIGMMAAAPAAFAQYTVSGQYRPLTEKTLEQVKKNFSMGLRSGNDGVIESTLMLVGQMKMRYPDCDMAELQRLVEQLAADCPSERIRYKAYLTAALCGDAEWFSADPKIMAAPSGQFFSVVAQRLNMKFFGLNGM